MRGAVATAYVLFVVAGFLSLVVSLNAVAAYVMTEKAAENAAREVAYQLAQSNIWTTQASLEPTVQDIVKQKFVTALGSDAEVLESFTISIDGRRVTVTVDARLPIWGTGMSIPMRASARSPVRTIDISIAFSIASAPGSMPRTTTASAGASSLGLVVDLLIAELADREAAAFKTSFPMAFLPGTSAFADEVAPKRASLNIGVVPFNHQVAHSVNGRALCDDARAGRVLKDSVSPAKWGRRDFPCDLAGRDPSRMIALKPVDDPVLHDYRGIHLRADPTNPNAARVGYGGCRDLVYGLTRAYEQFDFSAGRMNESVVVLLTDGPSTLGRSRGAQSNPDAKAVRSNDCDQPLAAKNSVLLERDLEQACRGVKNFKTNSAPAVRLVLVDLSSGSTSYPAGCDAEVIRLRPAMSAAEKAIAIADAILGAN